MELTEKQLIARIRAHGRGFVFTAKLFSGLTDDSASVRTALTRLVQKKSIRRLAHGLYDLPEVHPKLGPISPSIEKVIEAIKISDAIEVQPTGAYAANLLGLSTQIPMRIELYTNGPKRKIKFGKQEVVNKVVGFNENKLLVSTDIGLQYFDIQNHKFIPIFNSSDSLFNTQANECRIIGNKILAATKFGAFVFDLQTKQTQVFKNNPRNENSIAGNQVENIHYSSSSNYLWLTILNAGVDVVNLSTDKIVHINNNNAREYGIEYDNYSNILEDKDNNIWLGGFDITKYDPNKRKFGLLAKDFPNDFNLGFSTVWSNFVDSKGHLWLGEYAPHMGIMEVDRAKNFKKRYLEDATLTNTRNWKFSEDAKGNIFAICNSPNGWILYKKKSGANNFIKQGYVKDKTNISDNKTLGYSFLNNKNELIYTGDKPVVLSTSNGDTSYKPVSLPANLKGGILLVKRKSANELYVLNYDGIFLLNEANSTSVRMTAVIMGQLAFS